MVERMKIIGYCPNCEQPLADIDEITEDQVACLFCDEVSSKEEVESTPRGKY